MVRPKSLGKSLICTVLEWQVRRFRKRHSVQIIAVAGSIGKTSTKLAIAQVFQASGLRVRYQTGNYNDRLTVPLVLFDQPLPGLYNLFAWCKIFLHNERTIRDEYPYEIIVLELGTDKPGEIAKFAYLQPDLAVITGIAQEHMENFHTLDAVAAEELAITTYTKQVLINTDDTNPKYLAGTTYKGYGLLSEAEYFAEGSDEDLQGQQLVCRLDGNTFATAHIAFLGAQGRKIVLAAAATANIVGVEHGAIGKALASLKPFSGRMQILPGIKESTIIDDSYNAAPVSVEAALQVLVGVDTPQRIAVLGSMNELGEFSAESHAYIGSIIDPKKISLVVTVGEQAKIYLAPAALANGCNVHSFLSPQEAGDFVKAQLKPKGLVLCKGSQNGVFTEEAIKPLLLDPADEAKLVRQSDYWMRRKCVILHVK